MSISSSSVVAGMIAVALGVVPALAQEPAAQPAPAQPPAAAPAAPAAPAAQAPAADPAAPAAAAPAQAAQAEPDPPPPNLPTTGDGAVVVNLLTKVCKPQVEGGDFVALAKAAGMQKDRRSENYIMPLSQRPYQVEMSPPSATNKNVCEMRIRYAPGWDQPIIDAMNIWRFLHTPQLRIRRNEIGAYADAQRTSTTWDNWENQGYDGKMIGLILVQMNKPDGSAINPAYDEALIQYSQRKAVATAAQPAAPAAAQPAS